MIKFKPGDKVKIVNTKGIIPAAMSDIRSKDYHVVKRVFSDTIELEGFRWNWSAYRFKKYINIGEYYYKS